MKIEEFYGGDPRTHEIRRDQSEEQRARYLSREVDFGVWWLEGDRAFPRYRVTWVEATGEIYAFRQAVFPGEEDGEIRILGVCRDEAELERRLEGWPDRCGEPHGLTWVAGRLVREAVSRG
jgi:hypothetical protein